MTRKPGEYLLKEERVPRPKQTIPSTPAGKAERKPGPEQNKRRPKVLIIESENSILTVIEDSLKDSCEVHAYKCIKGKDSAIRMLGKPVDIVVIGPMYRDAPDDLAQSIRRLWPKTKIVRLAGTDEYRRITSEHPQVNETAPLYDGVLQFSKLFELEKTIAGFKL